MSEVSTSNHNFRFLHVFLIIICTVILSVTITAWLILSDIFVTEFKPVMLNTYETQVLAEKMGHLGVENLNVGSTENNILTAERYSESEEARLVRLTEKEVNALLANNTDLASKLAIDLSDNLASVKFLVPLDNELPILGGKTLKVTAGVELLYKNERPVVIIKGISVWGVPIPSAYLGNIKNVDLINEFGETGFWKHFADGINDLSVSDGVILINLKN